MLEKAGNVNEGAMCPSAIMEEVVLSFYSPDMGTRINLGHDGLKSYIRGT